MGSLRRSSRSGAGATAVPRGGGGGGKEAPRLVLISEARSPINLRGKASESRNRLPGASTGASQAAGVEVNMQSPITDSSTNALPRDHASAFSPPPSPTPASRSFVDGSPVTPRTSEFHRFAENLMTSPSPFSLMSPIADGLNAANAVPTSRDWGSFPCQLSASSQRGSDPALLMQQHALTLTVEEGFPLLLSAATVTASSRGEGMPPQPHQLLPSRGQGGAETEGLFFAIDPSSQRHLQNSTETLASRLTKRRWASSTAAGHASEEPLLTVPRLSSGSPVDPDAAEESHSDFTVDTSTVAAAVSSSGSATNCAVAGADSHRPGGGGRSRRGAAAGDLLHHSVKRQRIDSVAAVLSSSATAITSDSMGALGSPQALRLPATPGLSPPVGAAPGSAPLSSSSSSLSLSSANNGWKPVTCNCKKSKCLKLYCDCFQLLKLCDGCNCTQCANVSEYEHLRQKAILSILERNPEAFKPRVTTEAALVPSASRNGEGAAGSDGGGSEPTAATPASSSASPAIIQCHSSGCHCKKSACLKKYCVCFQAKVPCQSRCRCQDCKNAVSDGVFYDTTMVASQGHVLMSPDGSTPLKSVLGTSAGGARMLGLSMFGSPGRGAASLLPAPADAVLFGGDLFALASPPHHSVANPAPDSRSSMLSLSSGGSQAIASPTLTPTTPSSVSTYASASAAPRFSARVSVDVLSSILAAKLSGDMVGGRGGVAAADGAVSASEGAPSAEGTGSSSSSVLSPVDIIRSELIRLQREGLILSPPEASV